MADLVALVIGIAHYPDLPDTWYVQEDRTVKDAIAVTEALVARGVNPKKIKLLLSAKGDVPKNVAGVVPGKPRKEVLERFIRRELGNGDFSGTQFLFFCSGHGAAAKQHAETLFITPDSFEETPNNVFNCLGIEQLRVELQGLDTFGDQLFCVNACRTPSEWAIRANDQIEMVAMLGRPRIRKIPQVQFFAADELEPAPVEGTNPRGFSNGFAEAVVDCIQLAAWPPRASDWELRLHQQWLPTISHGVRGFDKFAFKQLYDARHQIDRQRQLKLLQAAVNRARTWNERRVAEPGDLWRNTLVDLHACTADCLDMLMHHIETTIFTDRIASGGVQRVARWPRRELDAHKRENDLIGELTYCLVEDRSLSGPDIVDALIDFAPGMRVVYLDIDGPCRPEDEPLINAMIAFWREIINEVHKRGTRVPCLPLLLVGHVDPEAAAPNTIDTTRFYHSTILAEHHERRLNKVAGAHLLGWIQGVFRDGDLRRPDTVREFARALGFRTIEEIEGVRMKRIIEIVDERA
jgi:hypothetical protein